MKNILLANSHGSVNVDIYFQVILKIHTISLYSSLTNVFREWSTLEGGGMF